MRRFVLIAVLLASLSTYAWEYASQEAITAHSAQIRTGAEMTKKWKNGLRLGVSEELRFDVYNSLTGAAFRNSYTTLTLAYAPEQHVKLDLGYTLKINGPLSTWTDAKKADPNEWIRHRIFFSVTGSYKFDVVKLSLRERALMEIRTDSVNPLEKAALAWQLRSKISAEFTVPGKPVKPYIWCELINTLNAPEYQQINGWQFITHVRSQLGVKWRLSSKHSLDFYYRFTYNYDRDINITKKKGLIELTEETLFQHAIGVTYCFDW